MVQNIIGQKKKNRDMINLTYSSVIKISWVRYNCLPPHWSQHKQNSTKDWKGWKSCLYEGRLFEINNRKIRITKIY